MSWFKKLLPSRIRTETMIKKGVPEGLWSKCDKCGAVLYRIELERNLEVCPKCQYHMRISARKRLDYFLDSSVKTEIGADVPPFRSARKDGHRKKKSHRAGELPGGLGDARRPLSGAHLTQWPLPAASLSRSMPWLRSVRVAAMA